MHTRSNDLLLDTLFPTELGKSIEHLIDRIFVDTRMILDPDDSCVHIEGVRDIQDCVELTMRMSIVSIPHTGTTSNRTKEYTNRYLDNVDYIEKTIRDGFSPLMFDTILSEIGDLSTVVELRRLCTELTVETHSHCQVTNAYVEFVLLLHISSK